MPEGPNATFSRIFRVASGILVALLIGALIAYYPAVRRYAHTHIFIVDNGEPIVFTAAAGDRVVLGVRVQSSINENWATTGLTATVSGRTVTLVGPVERTWGEEISTSSSESADDVDVAGNFTIPEVGGTGRGQVEGSLGGTVEYPTKSALQFREASMSVNVPLRITVTSLGGPSMLGPGPLLTTIVLGCVVVAAALLACAFVAVARLRWFMAPEPNVTSAFLGSPVLGVVVFFGTVLLENTLTPSAGDHNVMPAIPVSHWLFPSLLAAAVTVALFAASLSTND
jgi:hypothetical protein